MMYVLIVVVVVDVVVYACLKKKKRGDIEKPQDEKPDDNGGHTEITVKVPIESKGYIVKDGVKKEVTIRYMPQGLQVFDENGVCVLDITERLTRCIGSINISEAQKELMVPGITYKDGVLRWDINVLGDGKSFSATVLYGTY